MTSMNPEDRPSAAEVARSLGANEVRWPLEPTPVVGVPESHDAVTTAELPVAPVPPSLPMRSRAAAVAGVPATERALDEAVRNRPRVRRRNFHPVLLSAMLLVLALAGGAAYLLSASTGHNPAAPQGPSQTAVPPVHRVTHHSHAPRQGAAQVVSTQTHAASHSRSAKPSHSHSASAAQTSATSSAAATTTTTTPPPTTATSTTTETSSGPPPTTNAVTTAPPSAPGSFAG
jgi:hypothetical protein